MPVPYQPDACYGYWVLLRARLFPIQPALLTSVTRFAQTVRVSTRTLNLELYNNYSLRT